MGPRGGHGDGWLGPWVGVKDPALVQTCGAPMAAYQFIYVMKGLAKVYPGGRKVLDNIWLSFLPGAKIRR